MALCCDARDGERIRSRELSRTGVARVCGEVGSVAGWQSRRGVEWLVSRAMAARDWVSQGQCWGRCRVRRRAERVIRPTRAKNRRGPEGFGGRGHPGRCGLSSGPGCAPSVPPARRRWRRAPRGHVVQPDAVLEVAYRILDLGVAAMISLQPSSISPSRSVMKPCSCRWRRGRAGNRAWASPAGR